MKHERLEKFYALILLVVFGLIVVHAPLSVYFGTVFPGAELLIKSWKEILLVIATSIAVVLIQWRRLWGNLLRDHIMQLIFTYALLHALIASALLTGPLATMAGLAIDLRYVVYFALVYILMNVAPGYRKRFIRVGACGAAIVLGFAVLQIFLPPDILTHLGYGEDTIQPYLTVDQNTDFIRVNSTMRGPNPLGGYAVIVIGLLAAAFVRGYIKIRRDKTATLTMMLGGASVVALWISYSRSALGAACVTVAAVAAIAFRRHLSRRAWIAGAILIGGLAGGLLLGHDSSFVAHVLYHENPADANMMNSNEGHIESLVRGTKRMLRQPIGGGVGSTGSASLFTDQPLVIENQYLFVAHEVGWLGLLLFLALFGVILARLWQDRQDWVSLGVFASGLGLALIGLLLPVWVDDTVSIVWWGLAAIALGSGGKHARQQAK